MICRNTESPIQIFAGNVLFEKEIGEQLKLGEKSFQNIQYRQTKVSMLRILTLLSEEISGFAKKISSQQGGDGSRERTPSSSRNQELTLMQLPCEKTRHEKECKKAVELLKKSRETLGEEDVLQ